MPWAVLREIKRFKKYRVFIRNFLKDFRLASRLIASDEFNKRFLLASGLEFQLPTEFDQQCNRIVDTDVALVIFGQNNYSKAACVNNLFQRNLLPTIDVDPNVHWRPINIHSGHYSSNFVCPHDLVADSDSEIECSVDIVLNNELLLVEGLRIIVSPSCQKNTTKELSRVFNISCSGVLPVFMYAFESKALTPWDLIELTEVHQLAQGRPILFAVMPPRNEYQLIFRSLLLQNKGLHMRIRRGRRTTSDCFSDSPIGKSEDRVESSIGEDNSSCSMLTTREPQCPTNVLFQSKSLLDVHPQPHACNLSHNVPTNKAVSKNAMFSGDHRAVLSHLGFLNMRQSTCLGNQCFDTCDSIDFHTPASERFSSTSTSASAHLLELTIREDQCVEHSQEHLLDVERLRQCTHKRTLNRNSVLVTKIDEHFMRQLQSFVRHCLQAYLLWALDVIHASAVKCLDGLVLQAFNLSYNLLVTPKRMEYARVQESKLYDSLLNNVKLRQPETCDIISRTMREMRLTLPQLAAKELNFSESVSGTLFGMSRCHGQRAGDLLKEVPTAQCISLPSLGGSQGLSSSRSTAFSPHFSPSDVQPLQSLETTSCEYQTGAELSSSAVTADKVSLHEYNMAVRVVHEYLLCKLTRAIAARVLSCMEVMEQSYIGTLERTITNLENVRHHGSEHDYHMFSCPYSDCCEKGEEVLDPFDKTTVDHSATPLSEHYPHAESVPKETVHDIGSPSLPTPLVVHGECIFHSRPWPHDSLSKSSVNDMENCDTAVEQPNSVRAALKALLKFTYGIHVPVKVTPLAQVNRLLNKVREVFKHPTSCMSVAELDASWVSQTARMFLNSLSESAISKELHGQVIERLRQSHANFLSTLHHLELRTDIQNCRFEEAQSDILKQHAPRLSCIALETSSLRTYVLHGLPTLGKEIGRGQYGVVYACSNWASLNNLAVKSVVPLDDKHWRDLALEIYFSKQLPRHERIVTLFASVIDHSHRPTPSTLLVMQRLTRDLHMALKRGLSWLPRLTVAQDVIEGLRFLHGRGLIHRDIKPRNILLDENDRAKLTDMGFCKPRAMIAGSILGTPTHMAPEIFEHYYDSAVDVYAFAILFWHICAGSVDLPHNFQRCSNKEMLWRAVRKGLRPERLQTFTDDCWRLMEMCWTRIPRQRPHTGQVAEMLHEILKREVDNITSSSVKSK